MPTEQRPLKVFLCHASADKQKVRELYRYLRRRGVSVWFSAVDLLPGQDIRVEIPKAVDTSDAIIICLTQNSVDKEGYIQKEILLAVDKSQEIPEGRIFLIPARLEECNLPSSLKRYQPVNLYEKEGYAKLMKALKLRASQLERSTTELPLEKDMVSELKEVADEKKSVKPKLKKPEAKTYKPSLDPSSQGVDGDGDISDSVIVTSSGNAINVGNQADNISDIPKEEPKSLIEKLLDIRYISMFIALIVLLFGNNIYEQITGHSIFADALEPTATNLSGFAQTPPSITLPTLPATPILTPIPPATPSPPDLPVGHIVFTSERDGNPEVYVMDADGANQKQITILNALGILGRISPDGKRVIIGAYFSTSANNKLGRFSIYIVNIDGSGLTLLTEILTNSNSYPVFWSADGNSIYYIKTDESGNNNEIYLLSLDNLSQTLLAAFALQMNSPSISYDGKYIVFQKFVSSFGGSTDTFIIGTNGEGLTQVTDSPSYKYHPAWSLDGNRITFADSGIWLVNIDGKGLTSAYSGGGYSWSPTWSPDGNWIVFNNGATHASEDIFIVRTDGSNLMQLTRNSGSDNSPSWGP